jgi:hypothetical protein
MNAFKLVSRGVIFQKLRAIGGDIIQFIPFVHAFYTFEFPMFYHHYSHQDDVIIILFAMGTCQGDPLGGALFTLTHFMAMRFTTNHFLSCLFPTIANDNHIIGPFHCILCIWTFAD